MLVYRVFPHLAEAPSGTAGHPLHVGFQGRGRLDNPAHYQVWYLALEPAGAVAETFADLDEWNNDMFRFSPMSDSRYFLATYLLDDNVPLLDLDDAWNLYARGLRPSQVVDPNRAATQALALRIFSERDHCGARLWDGVRWWSYHRPQWRIVGYWGDSAPQLLRAEKLTLTSPAVTDAAVSLNRPCRSARSDGVQRRSA